MFPKPFSVYLLIIERCSYAITVQWSTSINLLFLHFYLTYCSDLILTVDPIVSLVLCIPLLQDPAKSQVYSGVVIFLCLPLV